MFMMFRRPSNRAAIDRDVARLVREFGEAAFSKAGELSWREDAGLMTSRDPGHWHRVQQEIGRREARPASETPRLPLMADPAVRRQAGASR